LQLRQHGRERIEQAFIQNLLAAQRTLPRTQDLVLELLM
jgi:hypothetical protein